jgi:AraC-like DNA-binding protein
MLEEACRKLGTDTLGLAVARQESLDEVYALGARLRGARTVWEHIAIATSFTRSPACAQSFGLELEGERMRAVFRHRAPVSLATHQADLEAIALTIKRFRLALGSQWHPETINLAYERYDHSREDEIFFGSHIQSGGRHSWIEFPARDGGRVFPKNSRNSISTTRTGGGEIPDDPVGLVKSQIRAMLPTGKFSIETVADSLGTSRRTLQRSLSVHGERFRTLLAQARLEQACSWLSDTDKRVDEIAFDLGYDDPANFSRAFRQRLGLPPSAFRRAHQAAHEHDQVR